MTDRDPFRSHRANDESIPPRVVGRVDIRQKRDDAAPTSISASGLLGWAARHGRSWNPIGVALMFALIWASIIGGGLYFLGTDVGKGLIGALKANTKAVKSLEAKVARLEAKADEALAGNKAIREELRIQGQGNATVRIVDLERKADITGQVLVKLNGARFNPSFPRSLEDAFRRAPGLPEPVYPMFTTDQQWALKPD